MVSLTSEPDPEDFVLTVTVRLYGRGTAEDAAASLREYQGTFELPSRPAVSEVEILDAQPAS